MIGHVTDRVDRTAKKYVYMPKHTRRYDDDKLSHLEQKQRQWPEDKNKAVAY